MLRAALFVLCLVALSCRQGALAAPAQMGEAFVDRFATFDETRWFVSDGWSNAVWMGSTFRRANVALSGEGVALTVDRNPADSAHPYGGAEFRSRESFRYGYFEGRLRVPRDMGLVTGFFTYVAATDALANQEIDIEILGRDTHQVELTLHVGAQTNTAIVRLPFDAAEGLHTYGFEWRPRAIRFYADGKRLRQVTSTQFPIPDREQAFFLDMWATEKLKKWSGGAPAGPGPWTLTASCVGYAPSFKARMPC